MAAPGARTNPVACRSRNRDLDPDSGAQLVFRPVGPRPLARRCTEIVKRTRSGAGLRPGWRLAARSADMVWSNGRALRAVYSFGWGILPQTPERAGRAAVRVRPETPALSGCAAKSGAFDQERVTFRAGSGPQTLLGPDKRNRSWSHRRFNPEPCSLAHRPGAQARRSARLARRPPSPLPPEVQKSRSSGEGGGQPGLLFRAAPPPPIKFQKPVREAHRWH